MKLYTNIYSHNQFIFSLGNSKEEEEDSEEGWEEGWKGGWEEE